MATQERTLDIDAVLELQAQPFFADKRFYVIDGEIFEMSPANRWQGWITARLGKILATFVDDREMGEVHTDVGFYPSDNRRTLLAPDVSFVSGARLVGLPDEPFLPLMPDLAVEVVSPSNTSAQIRRKAGIYLGKGGSLVWIVRPAARGVDVCRAAEGSLFASEFIDSDGILSGEDALPGFEVDVARLFPPSGAD